MFYFYKILLLSEYLYVTDSVVPKTTLETACYISSMKSQRNLIALYPYNHLFTDFLPSELCI